MANVELSEDIRATISVYANKMLHEVKLVLNTGNHEKRPELYPKVQNCSTKLFLPTY